MQLCALVRPMLTAPLTINTSAVLYPTPYTTRDALAFIKPHIVLPLWCRFAIVVFTSQGPRQYRCHGCLITCKNLPTGAWHPSWEQFRFRGTQFLQKLLYIGPKINCTFPQTSLIFWKTALNPKIFWTRHPSSESPGVAPASQSINKLDEWSILLSRI